MTALSTLVSYVFSKHGSREQNKLLTTPSCVDKFLSFKINDLFQITQKPQCCLNRATFFNYTYSKLIKQQKEKNENRYKTNTRLIRVQSNPVS